MSDKIIEFRNRLEVHLSNGTQPEDEIEKAQLPKYQLYRHLKGQKIMVLFSGGLDTSETVHFLSNIIGAEVITFIADLGSTEPRGKQWAQEQDKIKKRAFEVGAKDHVIFNGKRKLAELAMLAVMCEAGLDGGRGHPPGSSLSRVIICDEAVNYAHRKGCRVIFHGSNGLQNNPYRFHNGLKHYAKKLGYNLYNSAGEKIAKAAHQKVLSSIADPVKKQAVDDRFNQQMMLEATPNLDCPLERHLAVEYLKRFDVEVKVHAIAGNISTDENICGNEREEASISDVNHAHYPIDGKPENDDIRISIRFEKGRPIGLKIENQQWQESIPPEDVMDVLNNLGFMRHIGLYDSSEARPIKSIEREIHDSPALTILIEAHYLLRKNILPPYASYMFTNLSHDWSTIVMELNQFVEDPMIPQPDGSHCERLNRAFVKLNEDIDGEVTLTLSTREIIIPQIDSARIKNKQPIKPVTSDEIDSHAFRTKYSQYNAHTHGGRVSLSQRQESLRDLHEDCQCFIEQMFSLRGLDPEIHLPQHVSTMTSGNSR